jgi:hypothetical protein
MTTDYQMYITGEWCDSATGRRAEVFSPANGELIGRVLEGGREDTDTVTRFFDISIKRSILLADDSLTIG